MRKDLGTPVVDWTPPPRPMVEAITGQYCRLEPLSMGHATDLHAANSTDKDGVIWDYLPYGPYDREGDYREWVAEVSQKDDPFFFAILIDGKAVGVASYLRINPEAGSIEVGHINYSPLMQRSIAATEAMFLMMNWAFESGYRRYEWKCNALNARSRRAAMRLGLSYEGVFRQMMVVKGRNRNTAWYAAIDSEWPCLKTAFETWLSRKNFDCAGNQRQALSDLTAPVLVNRG